MESEWFGKPQNDLEDDNFEYDVMWDGYIDFNIESWEC